MFFIGIFGISDREKKIREFEGVVCPECGSLTRVELIEVSTCFYFFFIPTFSWNRRYYIRFRCCDSLFSIDNSYAKELVEGVPLDVGRFTRVERQNNQCPNCGGYVDPSFSYCPNCGCRLK